MTPAQQWARALAKYAPGVRAVARASIAKMRRRLPGAVEFVYDNYNALVMGFGKTERPSDAILSLVLFPRHVTLCFLEGVALPDPGGILRAGGSQVRALIEEAVQESGQRFTGRPKRRMIIRAVSAKQRPRRPRGGV